jgi:hypothetical protein
MSLLAAGSRQSRWVHRTASPLIAGSRQRWWVSSLAPHPVDLVDNDEHEDIETDIRTPSNIQRDGYGIIYDHRNKKTYNTKVAWNDGLKPWKEILNDEPCAMNLTNSFKTLSNKIEDVYQMKLKTGSRNVFISSTCIFFVQSTWLNES